MNKRKNKKGGLENELKDLASILNGEMKLRQKQEEIERLKVAAKKREANRKRGKILLGEEVLKKDDIQKRKVVQNIKLFEWEAPIRQKIPFDPKTYLFIVAGCLLFVVLLAVLGNYGLMFSILALLFFIYVAGTVEPINVVHSIKARGVETMDVLYEWFMLDSFWFSEKEGQSILIVDTKLRVPARLIMLIDEKDRAALFVLLQDKLEYKEIKKQGRFDLMSYGKYIPLESV